MIRSFLIFLSLLMFFPAAVQAKGSVKKGDTIPHDLALEDSEGKMRSFSDLTSKKGIVLVFVRSADWCPYCQKQLLELNESNEKFEKWGYEVVSISYDTKDALQKFVTKNKPSITMLSDPRSEAIKAFGVMNEDPAKGTRSYGIPHPGVFIIGKDKKVQEKMFKEGYKDRPATTDILAKIEALNPPEVPPMTIDEMGQDPIAPDEMFIETPEKIDDPIILSPEVESVDDVKFDASSIEAPVLEAPVVEAPKVASPGAVPEVIIDTKPVDPLTVEKSTEVIDTMPSDTLDPIIDEIIIEEPSLDPAF